MMFEPKLNNSLCTGGLGRKTIDSQFLSSTSIVHRQAGVSTDNRFACSHVWGICTFDWSAHPPLRLSSLDRNKFPAQT